MDVTRRVEATDIRLPMLRGLSLSLDDSVVGGPYPTARLKKGLLLADGGQELAEEGVGFGVPVVKRGAATVFPGTRELSWSRRGAAWEMRASFGLDLVERLMTPDGASLRSRPLYAAKDTLAALHRRIPALRGPLTAASSHLRATFDWVTTYEPVASAGVVAVTSTFPGHGDVIAVDVDLSGLLGAGLTEIVVMNEQGARHFDRYHDEDGIELEGRRIEPWREVTAEEATFAGSAHDVAFSLRRLNGALLFAGRELVGTRLAWSGFGYSLPPATRRFAYDITIAREP